MLDKRNRRPDRSGHRLVRFVERVDNVLAQFAGSADIGPYVAPDADRPTVDVACPRCGSAISTHATDRTGGTARLYCPRPQG